jgi:hypothetical protein
MIGNSMPRLLRSIVFPEPSQPFCCACEIVAPKKRRGKIDCAVLLLFFIYIRRLSRGAVFGIIGLASWT